MNKKNKIIVPELLQPQINHALAEKQILFFTASCGCGKTAILSSFKQNPCTCTLEINPHKGSIKFPVEEYSTYLIDNIHQLTHPRSQKHLVELMEKYPEAKFIITARNNLPGWLLPFYLEDKVRVFPQITLFFSPSDIQKLFPNFLPQEVKIVDQELQGYPLAISFLLQYYTAHTTPLPLAIPQIKQQIQSYLENFMFGSLTTEQQEFVTTLIPFDSFTEEFCQWMNPNFDCSLIIAQLLNGHFIIETATDYRFTHPFHEFLGMRWKSLMTEQQRFPLLQRAGEYFELHRRYGKALSCYQKINNHTKLSQLLEEYAQIQPGMGHFMEIEKYYMALPKEIVLTSPAIICGMSMIYALRANFVQSDYWYSALCSLRSSCVPNTEQYKDLNRLVVYLDIALPNKDIANLLNLLQNTPKEIDKTILNPLPLSITSSLPSVLNGGKDFSEWTKQDDYLYHALKESICNLLGDNGIGVLECGICESKLEKALDYENYALDMMGKLSAIQQQGSIDLEFVVSGLLARMHLHQGLPQSAKRDLGEIRKRFSARNETRFLPNLEASLCRIALLTNNEEEISHWMVYHRPIYDHNIWTMWRYQYLTLVAVWIKEENYLDALSLLAQLLNYCQEAHRPIDEANIHIFIAICQYHLKNLRWKDSIGRALDITHEYEYIATISTHGIAVLPLLTHCNWKKNSPYLKKVIEATRLQASYYPQYLLPSNKPTFTLTKAEHSVLRLICKDHSNNEIANILGIKLPTVKTHVSNILRKLNVRRRVEVKAAVKEQKLNLD